MPRARNPVAKLKRRKKILRRAKGYWGARKKLLRVAREAVNKAEEYAARDRRNRKRDMRRIWITRINAAVREHGLSYSRFMGILAGIREESGVVMNRKMLSELAVHDPEAFASLVGAAREAEGTVQAVGAKA